MNPFVFRARRLARRSGPALFAAAVLVSSTAALAAESANASIEVAQAAQPSVTELQEVTVKANPLGKTADELVQPSAVLSGDNLESKRRGTIGETLEQEPGVSTTDFGAGAGRPVIRGQAGPRVDVLENGLSASDVSDVSPDHAVTIDPSFARQVEVLKGPATLLYGSGASAGVVNIIDNRLPAEVDPGLHGAFETYYGTNGNERSAAGDLNYGLGEHHQLHLDFGERKMDDYDIPRCAGVDGSGSCGVLNNSNVQQQSAAFGYGYSDEGNSIAFSVSPFHTRYGLPSEELSFIDMNQTRYDLQGILNRPLSFLESVKLRAAYNTYTHAEFEDVDTLGTQFRNRRHEERLDAVHVPVFGWRGAFGVQHSFRQFDAVGEEALVPPSNSENTGVFWVEERPFSWGKLELGGRYEHDTLRRTDGADEARSFSPLSASAGAIVKLFGKDNHLKVYYTHSERSPVAEELYSFGPHGATATFERGNLDIRRETANNFELGFDHHDGRLSLEANLYYQRSLGYIFAREVDQGLNADGSGTFDADGIPDRVDDDGAFDPAGELLLVDYRQANARFYGVEGEAAYAVLKGAWNLTVRMFGDQVRGKIDHAGNAPRITPARYGFGLAGAHGPYHADLSYTRVTTQNDIAALETETSGYDNLAAELSWHFLLEPEADQESQLFIRGRNLSDDDQRRATSFIKDVAPLPGRTVIFGVRLAL